MMSLAVIDIGTNSTRLLIGELNEDSIMKRRECFTRSTRIGRDLSKRGYLCPVGTVKTLAALKEYKCIIEDRGIKNFVIVGTNALREARNSSDFIDEVKGVMGFKVVILSAEEEAGLSAMGALISLCSNPRHTTALFVDIGGGSTEIALWKEDKTKKNISLPLGAVRCFEGSYSREKIKKILLESLKHFSVEKGTLMVGAGGTITSLAAVHKGLDPYDPDEVHGTLLLKDGIKEIGSYLSGLSLEKRKGVAGLEENRSDIILPGIMILLEIMEWFAIDEITASDRDLLDGLALSYGSKKSSFFS
ncbi:MAG: hypothetical protein GX318_04265 [Clostridia bacterium]|nr:hypothetical protein [Clostridia bacterium]